MDIVVTNRKQVIEQTAQNLIEARVAYPHEYEKLVNNLLQLDPKDLLAALLESWKFRDECKEPIKFCPISQPIGSN